MDDGGPDDSTADLGAGFPVAITATQVAVSLIGGGSFASAIVWHAHTLGYPVFDTSLTLVPIVALTALGAAPVVALLSYGLVTPTVVVALAVGNWLHAEADPGPGDPFIGFFWLVPLWLAVAAVVAAVEHRIRAALR